jgi:hypothetical protein
LEMISQFLLKRRSSESSLGRVCDLSVESDVLSMHEWGSPDGKNKLSISDPYLSGLFSIWFICAFLNEKRELQLEVEFTLVGILHRV